MIEQEKREKAIGTLSKIVCDGCGACCGCFSKRGWENLYYYILRKEKEVRKEVFNKLIEVSKNFDGNLPLGVLKAWAIEFGVEVEE